MSRGGRVAALVPLFQHLRGYRRADVYNDLLAGTITAILLVPQTLAYSLLAGLPPQMGLYAGIVPPIVYALSGTSRMSVVGPVAVQAVMIAAAIAAYAVDDTAGRIGAALILAATSGIVLVALGVLRMGWLTNFISRPVLSGFTTGAAIFIISAQLGSLMGVSLPRNGVPLESLVALGARLGEFNATSCLFGGLSVLLLVLARKPLAALFGTLGFRQEVAVLLGRAAPLAAVVIGIAGSIAVDASARYGVTVVGMIPQGLPSLNLDFVDGEGWVRLAPSAVLIAIVGYVETISVSRVLAFRRRQTIDPDRELLALGLANLGSAGFGGMPVASGFTKSAANFEAGAKSQLSAIVAACWVALSAALLAGLLEALPRAVLSAIIIVAVWQLIDLRSLRHNWRYSRGDGLSQIVTMLGVLVLGVEEGLVAGTAVAAALFLYRTSRPHIVAVGRIPGTEHYRSVKRRKVETWERLLLIRIDESLYYANTSRVESELQRLVIEYPRATDVVLILSAVGHVDASSLEMLESFERELDAARVRLHIAEVKGPLMGQLRGTMLLKRIGPSRVHLSVHHAVMSVSAGAIR